MKIISLDEFHAALKAQGVPREKVLLKCPMCGTLQSMEALVMAGAGETTEEVEKYFGFSCIGRWTHQKPPPKTKGTQVGCNWTLGGLLCLHDLEVVTPDDKKHPSFEVATPAEVKQHFLAARELK